MRQAEHGGKLSQAVRESGREEADWLDFSANMNPFAPEIPEGAWLGWRQSATRYPEADAESVKALLAETYGLAEEHIVPTAGGSEALYLVARLLTGRRIAVVEPAFSDYRRACHAVGLSPTAIVLPSDEWFSSLSEWGERLAGFDAVMLGNPNNPTGAYQPIGEWRKVLDEERSRVWVVDEAFIELGDEMESLTSLLEDYPNLMVVRSLTKSWGIPGLRLGFVATARSEWLEALRGFQPPWAVNAIAMEWAATMLNRQSHLKKQARVEAELPRLREQFRDQLANLSGLKPYPSWTNFLLVEITDPSMSASVLYRSLKEEGFLVRVCDSFEGMPKGRFLRVAVKSEHQNRQIVGQLKKICGTTTWWRDDLLCGSSRK